MCDVGGVIVAELDVRGARLADLEAAITVWRLATIARHGGRPVSAEAEAGVRVALQQPGAFLIVAEGAARVVGMGLAVPSRADDVARTLIPGRCFIPLIYVAPDRWGQGVGTKIVDGVLAEARVRGYNEVQLWTSADNVRARRLYEGRGFRHEGHEQIDNTGKVTVLYERGL